MKKLSVAASLSGVYVIGAGLLLAMASPLHAQNWTGPYVSVLAGGNQAPSRGESLIFDSNADGTFGDTVKTYNGADAFAPGFCNGAANGPPVAEGCYEDANRASLAARIGYDWQIGSVVLGLVADYNSLDLTDGVAGFASDPSLGPDSYSLTRHIDGVTALRARVGYAASDWLVYATGGAASADMDRGFMTSNALNTFTATDGEDARGYQAGAGFEHRFDARWTIGVEYLRTSLDDKGVVVHAGPGAVTFASNMFVTTSAAGTDIRRSEDRLEIDTVMVSLSYRFGPMM